VTLCGNRLATPPRTLTEKCSYRNSFSGHELASLEEVSADPFRETVEITDTRRRANELSNLEPMTVVCIKLIHGHQLASGQGDKQKIL
jgi:hypothetical protein